MGTARVPAKSQPILIRSGNFFRTHSGQNRQSGDITSVRQFPVDVLIRHVGVSSMWAGQWRDKMKEVALTCQEVSVELGCTADCVREWQYSGRVRKIAGSNPARFRIEDLVGLPIKRKFTAADAARLQRRCQDGGRP